ncbi:hypothetical protein JYB62_01475 [Algoriphagus lutimaris]|uniref:hypothetical protein n=1 Tax=Algoriphagus lutimaris TaxID=613197 RepID=UPI00196A75A1|nr:hypothetical protein [Algoriphagus lutimaris]MBN3518656.1 hypothetical protein [Algoriphagus lutimaris]
MYNKIKSIVTGYKNKKVTIGEIEIKLAYQKKFTKLDPLAHLRSIKHELLKSPIKSLEHVDFKPFWEEKKKSVESLIPTHEACFSVHHKNYLVKRYVTKHQNRSVSIYTYSADGKTFAIFTRKYDYGDFHCQYVISFFKKYNLEGDEKATHCIKTKEYSIFLNHFGHSHSLIWNNQTELDRFLSILE